MICYLLQCRDMGDCVGCQWVDRGLQSTHLLTYNDDETMAKGVYT